MSKCSILVRIHENRTKVYTFNRIMTLGQTLQAFDFRGNKGEKVDWVQVCSFSMVRYESCTCKKKNCAKKRPFLYIGRKSSKHGKIVTNIHDSSGKYLSERTKWCAIYDFLSDDKGIVHFDIVNDVSYVENISVEPGTVSEFLTTLYRGMKGNMELNSLENYFQEKGKRDEEKMELKKTLGHLQCLCKNYEKNLKDCIHEVKERKILTKKFKAQEYSFFQLQDELKEVTKERDDLKRICEEKDFRIQELERIVGNNSSDSLEFTSSSSEEKIDSPSISDNE